MARRRHPGYEGLLAYHGRHIACYANARSAAAAAAAVAAAGRVAHHRAPHSGAGVVADRAGRSCGFFAVLRAARDGQSREGRGRHLAQARQRALVSAADSPLTGPLAELLLRSFGPRQVVAEELAGVAGIESAFLFGSWAARYRGQPGRPPGDIDVLVIGDPDRDDLDEAAQRAGARLATEVNVTIRSPRWWREGGDGFHAEVTGRRLVPVFDEPNAP